MLQAKFFIKFNATRRLSCTAAGNCKGKTSNECNEACVEHYLQHGASANAFSAAFDPDLERFCTPHGFIAHAHHADRPWRRAARVLAQPPAAGAAAAYISPISPLCLPYISPISPLYLHLLQEEKGESLPMCSRCNGFKPPRAHHCSQCDRCVMKMDPHCP